MEDLTSRQDFEDSSSLNRFDDKFSSATTYEDILRVINIVVFQHYNHEDDLLEERINEDEEKLFYEALLRSFDEINLHIEERIELLSAIAESSSISRWLYDAVVDKACKIIDDNEGAHHSSVALAARFAIDLKL